jgi:hypothetical protein
MKAKESPNTEKAKTTKTPDLRHGSHGSVMTNAIDAGQAPATSDAGPQLASPDIGTPAGQMTHE